MSKKNEIPPEFGYFALIIARIFRVLQYFPPQCFIGSRVKAFKDTDFNKLTPKQRKDVTIKRARKIDLYMIVWLLVEIAGLLIAASDLSNYLIVEYSLLILVSLRLIDIVQVNVNLSLFDVIRVGRSSNYMASVIRTIINVIINYFEILLCFTIIYIFNIDSLKGGDDWIDALYFSSVTQVTLGFGEIFPEGAMKLISILQLLLGFFFTALIIGRFISLLPQSRTIAKDGESDDM